MNVLGEIARARAALEGIEVAVLARAHDGAAVTPDRLRAALRGDGEEGGPDVLYLVCHGGRERSPAGAAAGPPFLWLEREDGRRLPVPAGEIERLVADLPRRPVLVVLAACQSAGRTHDAGALAAAGPRLGGRGRGRRGSDADGRDGDHRRAAPAGVLPPAAAGRSGRPGPGGRPGGRARPAGLVGAGALPAPARRAPVDGRATATGAPAAVRARRRHGPGGDRSARRVALHRARGGPAAARLAGAGRRVRRRCRLGGPLAAQSPRPPPGAAGAGPTPVGASRFRRPGPRPAPGALRRRPLLATAARPDDGAGR